LDISILKEKSDEEFITLFLWFFLQKIIIIKLFVIEIKGAWIRKII
jgi:hypothetical protein